MARGAGLTTMRDHALYLVDNGVMALEELPTFLPPERLAPDHGPAPVVLPKAAAPARPG